MYWKLYGVNRFGLNFWQILICILIGISIPPENIKTWFSDVFRGYGKKPVVWNGLNPIIIPTMFSVSHIIQKVISSVSSRDAVTPYEILENVSWTFFFKDSLQVSLLILSEYKRIHELLFPRKLSGTHRFSFQSE